MTTYLTLKDWVKSYMFDHPETGFVARDIQAAIVKQTVRPAPDINEIKSILYNLVREKSIFTPIPGVELYKIVK